MDKETLMIVVNKEDADYFKSIQKEYKKKGYSALVLFNELIQAHKEAKKK